VEVHKEYSYSEYKEVQWSVNEVNGFGFSNSSRILKFELRRPPANERIEDVQISWNETNPTGVDVSKLPTFFNCCDSIRVKLNNVEVVDLKSIDGIRTEYKDRLHTRFKTESERDYYWNWTTGVNPVFFDGSGLITPLLIPAGESRLCYASMSDLLGGVFDGLPWSSLFLCEIEITLASQQRYISDVPEGLQITHNNITVYSRHKKYTISVPKPFSSHTLFHVEHEVLKISSPSPLHTGGNGTLVLDLHTFLPRRTLIQRIHVFSQGDETGLDSYRVNGSRFIGSLLLERNGDEYLATEHFYRDRRSIAHQTQKYFRRHHGGVTSAISDIFSNNFGAAHSEMFIDCTAVSKTLNASPIMESKVKASEGIDNLSNLNLTITAFDTIRLTSAFDVVVVVEWLRFDRINAGGRVSMIANA
jgi:hypothetical protein